MKEIFILAMTLMLAACASEKIGRENPSSIQLVSADFINTRRIMEAVVCITEGFKRPPQTIWHNHQTFQEIILNGYRIEMRGTLGGTIMLSADVMHDGTVKLYSSIYGQGALIDIDGQKQAGILEYKKCVNSFAS